MLIELPMSVSPRLATACAAFALLAACQPDTPKPAATPDAVETAGALAAATDETGDAAVDAEALPAINCGEGRLAKLMNQPENDETHAAVIAAVGHRHVRWVHPGDAVTMDYQPGRLNVIVDERGKIAATRCG
jgi:nitrous oxide reductase accessory protein NosL